MPPISAGWSPKGRAEFAAFSAFADPATRSRIPDPQDVATWHSSRLQWNERIAPRHAGVQHLYRTLLRLRRNAFGDSPAPFDAQPLGDAS
jgi:1,4-alpha-glucan branching enzyme